MSQQPPTFSSDDPGALYPPTMPEWAVPREDHSSTQPPIGLSTQPTIGLPRTEPTYPLYPGQPSEGSPGGYSQPAAFAPPSAGTPTPYGQPSQYEQPNRYTQPQYPPPPQYDPRTAQYGQSAYGQSAYGQTAYGQTPYSQPVVFQTVVNHPVPVPAPKSVGVSYVLWFFLGLLGVHHFYLGRIGWGVAYLLCTVLLGWIGIGVIVVGIGCLIDLFLIPSYTRDANQLLTGYRF